MAGMSRKSPPAPRSWRVIEIAKKGRHIATLSAPDADAAIRKAIRGLRDNRPASPAPACGPADRVVLPPPFGEHLSGFQIIFDTRLDAREDSRMSDAEKIEKLARTLSLNARPDGEGWRVRVTDKASGHWAEFDQTGAVKAKCAELSGDDATLSEWSKIVLQFLRRGP